MTNRRELLQGLVLAPLPFLAPRIRSFASPLSKYPPPEFAIGDLVATDWIDDENPDKPEPATDFGEVLGMRWVSENDVGVSTYPLPANSWVYYVNWTRSTIGCESCFPCYDGESIFECDLRLASHD